MRKLLRAIKGRKKAQAVLLLVSAVVLASIASWLQFSTQHAPLPDKIKKDIVFAPYSNGQTSAVAAPSQLKYDKNVKALSYVTYVKGTRTVVSQQPLPASFTSSEGYSKFITSFGGGDAYKTSAGTFYITYPHDAGGGQTAVMNTGKVLLFVKPDKQLSVDELKQFFSTLSITR